MAAENPKGPLERLEELTSRVHAVEAAFEINFVQWGKKNLPNAAQHFLWGYTETIHAMELIRAEKFKDDADPNLKPDLDSLFQRVIKLLHLAVEHVKVAKYELRQVHKELLKNVFRINNTPDVNNDGLNMHQIKMGRQLAEIRPPKRRAWMKGAQELKPNSDFDRVYREFRNLKRDARIAQTRHEMYATRSWQLLASAFQELDIPVMEVLPQDDFFDNDTRWTFVDYPYGSHEFLYGKNSRPGMLALKQKVGGFIVPTQREQMSGQTDAVANMARVVHKPVVNSKDERKPKEKSKKKEKNKKRSTNDAGPNPKKTRIGLGGYTMNIVNAAADIEDCLRDSKFTAVKEDNVERPGSERLVTPTVETRRTTLVAYHEALLSIIDEVYKRRFGTPTSRSKLPQTAEDRKKWLDRASKELMSARADVNSLIDSANTPAKAKKLRLAAYKLKLLRSMYTIGLVSGDPAASEEEIREGLIGRLDDWIVHEQAWNAAEQVVLRRPGITQETYDLINGQIEERDANIARWKELRAEVEKGPSDEYEAEPAKGLEIFGSPGGEAEPEYEIREEEINADTEDEHDKEGSDPSKVQEGGEKDGEEQEPQDPFGTVLTDQEIKNGWTLLWNVLFPKRPDAGDYLLDWREERRHRRWYKLAAQARLADKPLPPWNHLPITDIYAAGGPPGHEKLPRKTVWERLQYMLVMTYWRFYQLRLMEP